MGRTRYSSKVVYYGGYPGSSGKPMVGRLQFDGEELRLVARSGEKSPVPPIPTSRLRGVRRMEEGLTGGRRVRLLIDVETDAQARATLKFEMGGLLWKERKLARWIDVLGSVCTAGEKGA
ncbi:MAG: hypothetical protein N3D11_16560 [Candidatus Sumerlaeia bacterium]|nr:hypothetical protein [Candidatus Sumerlaeia bacterium]